jgi:hypothetical protein
MPMSAVRAEVSTRCSACGGPRCDHENVLSRLLGCERSDLCLHCLAFAFGLEPARFARGAVAHLRKKSCLWLEFERTRACRCELARAGEGR